MFGGFKKKPYLCAIINIRKLLYMEIKNVIKAKGFTLEQVASQIENKNGGKGISQSALTQMLNGNPSISRVMEIAKIVGVSVSELVGESYIMENEDDVKAYIAMEGNKEVVQRRVKCPHCHNDLIISIEEVSTK